MAAFRYLVNDVPASIEFYTSHLGFNVVEQYGPAMAILSRDDVTFWLAGSMSSAAKPIPDGRKPAPGGWNRLVLIFPKLDETVTNLKTAGCKFRNEAIEGPGGKQILLDDPSGNCVELFEPR
jgi:catechol 2,3-dioxygenase-like lactoylglutathione lyase family enzyme